LLGKKFVNPARDDIFWKAVIPVNNNVNEQKPPSSISPEST